MKIRTVKSYNRSQYSIMFLLFFVAIIISGISGLFSGITEELLLVTSGVLIFQGFVQLFCTKKVIHLKTRDLYTSTLSNLNCQESLCEYCFKCSNCNIRNKAENIAIGCKINFSECSSFELRKELNPYPDPEE